MMINYLFYRVYQINKSVYWAKIFVSVAIALALLPTCLTLSKYLFGCYNQDANDGIIKLIILVVGITVMMVPNLYYSAQRVKKISDKYSSESRIVGNVKMILIWLILFGVFMFGSALVRYLVNIPEC